MYMEEARRAAGRGGRGRVDASSGHVVWQRKLDAPDPGSGGVIVGAGAVYGQAVVFLVNEFTAPTRSR
jgi:hypothetical protein